MKNIKEDTVCVNLRFKGQMDITVIKRHQFMLLNVSVFQQVLIQVLLLLNELSA